MRSSRSSSPTSRPPRSGTSRCPGALRWSAALSARATLVVLDGDGEKVLGPRFIRLLEMIRRTGSVRQAALAMGLGYRHAIDWIARAEAALHRPVVARHAGGVAGGGSGLTPEGIAIVRGYGRVRRALDRVVARAEHVIFPAPAGRDRR